MVSDRTRQLKCDLMDFLSSPSVRPTDSLSLSRSKLQECKCFVLSKSYMSICGSIVKLAITNVAIND